MTTVYFIRHAQSDHLSRDDATRPLTEVGMADTFKIVDALKDKGITSIISSPHMRALQTIAALAKALNIQVEVNSDFRERVVGEWMPNGFYGFVKKQWYDPTYRTEKGESLSDCQIRCVSALRESIKQHKNETIAIATHGTALATIINRFFPEFGYTDVMRIINYMPYVVRMDFDRPNRCVYKEDVLIIERRYER